MDMNSIHQQIADLEQEIFEISEKIANARRQTVRTELNKDLKNKKVRLIELNNMANINIGSGNNFSAANINLGDHNAFSGSNINLGRMENLIIVNPNYVISADAFSDKLPFLTPTYLYTTIAPYLLAIESIQNIIDEILGKESVVFLSLISQNSPLSINLSGATEAIKFLQDLIIPWRRKNIRKHADLAEKEKEHLIAKLESEKLEIQSRINKDSAESQKILAEAEKLRAEAQTIQISNYLSAMQIRKDILQIALEMVEQISPNLSQTDKISYAIRLIPHMDTIVSHPLTITSN
jgi:hypothetical protein